jgi:hypothetical protein
LDINETLIYDRLRSKRARRLLALHKHFLNL